MSQDAGQDDDGAGPGVVESDGGFARGAGSALTGGPGMETGTATEPDDPVGQGGLLRPGNRSLYAYFGSVVAVFVAAGIGLGLGSNFILGFLIEQFVEPGTNPTDNTIIGIMLLHNVITPFLVGPLMAIGAGAILGRALPDRRVTAVAVGGAASLVGFYLMTGLTLFLTIDVLSQYGAGGGGGALDQAALGKQVIESGIPAAIVGGMGAYVGSYLAD